MAPSKQMVVHCREPQGARCWGIQFISDRGTEERWGIRAAYARATQGYRQQTSKYLPTRHSNSVFKKINPLCKERLAWETFYLSNTRTSENAGCKILCIIWLHCKSHNGGGRVYKTTFLGGKTQEMFPVGVGVNMCFLLTCGFFGVSLNKHFFKS